MNDEVEWAKNSRHRSTRMRQAMRIYGENRFLLTNPYYIISYIYLPSSYNVVFKTTIYSIFNSSILRFIVIRVLANNVFEVAWIYLLRKSTNFVNNRIES